MYSQEVQEKVASWLAEIEQFVEGQALYLPDTVELNLDPSDDLEWCQYYFVDHAARVEFWMDEVNSETLRLRTSASEDHMST